MVSIKEVHTWNDSLSNYPPGLVIFFAGATSGIGLATLKALARHLPAPTVYIAGRSKAKFQTYLGDLLAANPEGNFIFLEGDVSLLKEVDRLAAEVIRTEKKLDLLVVSQGAIELGERKFTSEGLSVVQSLRYYSRFRFIQQLLPLLSASSSPSPRIISVYAAGQEGELDISDMDLMRPGAYSIGKAGGSTSTMTTLAMEHLSATQTGGSLSFAHTFPGLVATDLLHTTLRDLQGWRYALASLARWTIVPALNRFVSASPEEAGERALFIATSPRYASAADMSGSAAVAGASALMPPSVTGGSVYRVKPDGETWVDDKVLGPYRKDNIGEKVWQHTLEVFERVTGRAE